MGRGGGNDDAERLLYGKPVKLKGGENRKSAAVRSRELREEFDRFRFLMIRNTDISDPETDAGDFLADLMHWTRSSRFSDIELLQEVSQPFYERYRQVSSITDLNLDIELYYDQVNKKHLSPKAEKPSVPFEDRTEARAQRIDAEMKEWKLEPDQTMALFRIWCDRLDLDFDEIREKAYSHYQEEI